MLLDQTKLNITGRIIIRDHATREIICDKQNAVHYGNFSAAVVRALQGGATSTGQVQFIAFGSGGSSTQTSGAIVYAEPNVSPIFDAAADLNSPSYIKDLTIDGINSSIEFVNGANSDLRITTILGAGEPALSDNGETIPVLDDLTMSNESDFLFDEVGLKDADGNLLTHVRFHPVLKSSNRIIEIEYTIRVQMA